MSGVTAIVFGPRASAATGPPGAAATLAVADLGAVRGAAADADGPLVWLLDGSAAASAETLARLLEHADAPAASLPVDAAGVPVEAAIGRIDDDDPTALLARVAERRVPLRHTRVTSLLVETDLVTATAPPDPRRFGAYAGIEWTARLFAHRAGMLVPASRVEVAAPAAGAPVHVLRTARSGAWRRGEAVREAYRALTPGASGGS